MIYGLGMPLAVAEKYMPEEKTAALAEKRTQQKMLLNIFSSNGGRVKEACTELKISYDTFKTWRRRDPLFAEAYIQAKEDTLALLEDEIVRRAIYGTEEPVYFKGQECGRVTKYSDNLLMFLTKKLDPSYKDNNNTNIGIMGEDIKISFVPPKKEELPPHS